MVLSDQVLCLRGYDGLGSQAELEDFRGDQDCRGGGKVNNMNVSTRVLGARLIYAAFVKSLAVLGLAATA